MMRELDILLGRSNQEWSEPFAEEPQLLPAEAVDEVSRVYSTQAALRRPEATAGTGRSWPGRWLSLLAKWLLLATALTLLACDRSDAASAANSDAADGEPAATELRYLGNFGTVSFPELAEDLGYLAPLKLRWLGNVLGGPEAIQAVATGDADFGAAATGSVVKMIASGAPVQQVIAIHGVDDSTWGGYFTLEGSPLRSARDLIGKKVAVNTLGAHAEFMTREWLRRGGLSREEAKQVTLLVLPPANTEQALRAGNVHVGGLGGIFRDRALERGGLRALFTDRELFGHFNSATLVVQRRFAQEHPSETRHFVTATARAIEWARATPAETVRARFADIFKRRGRNEDPAPLKYWRSVGVRGAGGVLEDSDVRIWVEWLEREGDLKPGQVASLADLYTNDFNVLARKR